MSVAAIIVAAGPSTRLKQPKQLVLLDGEPLLQRAVRSAGEAGVGRVFAVLGAHRDVIQDAVEFGTATVLANDEWEEGLASSIRAGVKAVEEADNAAAGVLLMTCDQPRVTAGHLRQMIEQFHKRPTVIIASTYAGIRGTPAVFPRTIFLDLLALRGDRGARGLLADTLLPVVEVPLEGGELDIDLPQDLAMLK